MKILQSLLVLGDKLFSRKKDVIEVIPEPAPEPSKEPNFRFEYAPPPKPQETMISAKSDKATKQTKGKKPVLVHGTVELKGDVGNYLDSLTKAKGNTETYLDVICDLVKLSRAMNCSTLAIYNYTRDVRDGVENTGQSITVMSNENGRWKKLFSNPIRLDRLDVFVTEFELAFEQHGYASHHDSTKLFKDFLTSALVPAIAKQRKKRVDEPQKKTHLRMTVKAYTDNTTNPLDCPSIVTTVTYTENEIPSSVSMTMKYQKPQSNAYA